MPSVAILLGGIVGLACVAVYCWIIYIQRELSAIAHVDEQGIEDAPSYVRLPFIGQLWRTEYLIRKLARVVDDSEAKYKILTDNLAAAVIMHQADGCILWCSPYTEVLTGYSRAEIYADKHTFLSAHVHEDDRGSIQHALAIAASGEPFQCRYRFYHKSGLCLWLETRTAPIFDPQSQSYHALSISLDVTASVNAQLKVEQRNRDLNEFTYMLSHDLKAPVVTLRGMLEIIKAEVQGVQLEQASEPIDYMGKAICRIEKLVEGVLELARVSTTEREVEAVDLTAIVEEIVEEYQWQIDQAGASVAIEGEIPWAFGNKTQFYQVFSNLIGNALKYGDDSRRTTVTIRAGKATSRRRAIIEVSDNGRGIAPEFQQAVFAPFARAGETSIEGSGVGLAAVRRILDKVGGAISVSSVVGEGSTFTLDLRRAMDAENSCKPRKV